MTNQSTVKIQLTRGEICRFLLVASTFAHDQTISEDYRRVWQETHDKLKDQLAEYDRQHKVMEGL